MPERGLRRKGKYNSDEKARKYLPERRLRRKGKYNSGGKGVEILAGEGTTQERQVQFRRGRRGNTCLKGKSTKKASN